LVLKDEIISSTEEVLDLDLKKAPSDFDSFSQDFALMIKEESELNALVGWFDAEMTNGVWFSTGLMKETLIGTRQSSPSFVLLSN
jgi:hypothetical protein